LNKNASALGPFKGFGVWVRLLPTDFYIQEESKSLYNYIVYNPAHPLPPERGKPPQKHS